MIAPTIDIARAAESIWDVVIIGAGPAGALAARECARRDLATILIDKTSFPRYKVCGCCVNARARHALGLAGLGTFLDEQEAVPLHVFHVASRGLVARIALPRGYVSLSRERFDSALVREAIGAGAQFLPETKAELGGLVDDARELVLRPTRGETLRGEHGQNFSGGMSATAEGTTPKRVARLRVPPVGGQGDERSLDYDYEHEHGNGNGRGIRARLVLAADGLASAAMRSNSGVAIAEGSHVGIGAVYDGVCGDYDAGITYMACGRHGYLGLQRLEDGRLDLAAAVDAGWMRASGGPASAATALLRESGLPPLPDLDRLTWKGTPPLTRRPASTTRTRVFALGDAAGYVEPFTGEGMAWALSAAVAVAPIAARAVAHYDETIERAWQTRHRDLVTRRQWICKAMAAGLRRPLVVSLGVRAVSTMPGLAQPLIRRINRAPMDEPVLPSSA